MLSPRHRRLAVRPVFPLMWVLPTRGSGGCLQVLAVGAEISLGPERELGRELN